MITGVAFKSVVAIFMLPKPYRHHDIIHRVNRTHPGLMHGHGVVQGFVDQDGKFYNRIEAAQHALACGQIEKLNTPPELFSEDLW